jgi:hypothetical protein
LEAVPIQHLEEGKILGSKKKVSAGLLITSSDTRGKNTRKAVAKLFSVSVDNLSIES